MALPVDYNTVTVTGKYVYLDGTPVAGSITFAGKIVATSISTLTNIIPKTIVETLDENGQFSVTIPATDDPDITPNGWTYTVTENFPGGRTYEIDIPVVATTIDLATVAPTTPDSGDPTAFVTLSAFEAHVAEGDGGGGGGAVDSVNGQTGVVILDAADVGAADAVHTHTIANVTSLQTALDAKAPLASPAFTGTPTGITKTHVGLGNVDNTADTAKPVSTAQQTALNLKANLASPTFTGTVSGITAAMVGLGSVDNTADTAKPVSTAQQTALNLKANLASPTFTGTVSGITKSMVGLGNVDNTADTAKPVSSAQQTALDAKAAGAASSTDNAVARFDSTTGKVIQNSGVTISDSNDVTGIRAILRTIAADYGADYLDRIDLNYAPATTDMDMLRIYVNGVMAMWLNENGFLRGTPHTGYKDDALVRGRARSDLSGQSGGYIELENSSSQLLHRRRWTDGALVRGNGSGTIVCADVLVLATGAGVPAGTPVGTVIIRTP